MQKVGAYGGLNNDHDEETMTCTLLMLHGLLENNNDDHCGDDDGDDDDDGDKVFVQMSHTYWSACTMGVRTYNCGSTHKRKCFGNQQRPMKVSLQQWMGKKILHLLSC